MLIKYLSFILTIDRMGSLVLWLLLLLSLLPWSRSVTAIVHWIGGHIDPAKHTRVTQFDGIEHSRGGSGCGSCSSRRWWRGSWRARISSLLIVAIGRIRVMQLLAFNMRQTVGARMRGWRYWGVKNKRWPPRVLAHGIVARWWQHAHGGCSRHGRLIVVSCLAIEGIWTPAISAIVRIVLKHVGWVAIALLIIAVARLLDVLLLLMLLLLLLLLLRWLVLGAGGGGGSHCGRT